MWLLFFYSQGKIGLVIIYMTYIHIFVVIKTFRLHFAFPSRNNSLRFKLSFSVSKISCLSLIFTLVLWTFTSRERLPYVANGLDLLPDNILWNWIWFHNFKDRRNKMTFIFPILRKLNLLILCATELNQKIQSWRNRNFNSLKYILSWFTSHF
jgi:hypothetical protein